MYVLYQPGLLCLSLPASTIDMHRAKGCAKAVIAHLGPIIRTQVWSKAAFQDDDISHVQSSLINPRDISTKVVKL